MVNMKMCLTLSAAAVLSLATAALAGDDHNMGEEMSFGRPGDPEKVTRTATIEATEIAFNMQELTFKTGETVKFVFVNKGEQNHELTIGDSETQLAHRKMMAEMPVMDHAQMSDMEMSGMQGHDHMMEGNIVDTAPGETKTLVWQFTKPGTFEFACNYPGHAEVGMEGKIVVQ
jgi:uncharacterized cupredoxin-like copper-binding protein